MKKLCGMFVAITMFLSFAANAADTGPVREFYACNFQDGKGMDDLMAIRDVIAQEIENSNDADLSNQISILWTPVKTNGQIDFLWFDMHASLNAMGRAARAFERSDAGAKVAELAAEIRRQIPQARLVGHPVAFGTTPRAAARGDEQLRHESGVGSLPKSDRNG